MPKYTILILILLTILNGCASHQPLVSIPTYDDLDYPENNNVAKSGSIYVSGTGMLLYKDNKAKQVGDIITILLSEETSATKSASTNTAKSNEIDIANPTILGASPSFRLPKVLPLGGRDLNFENTFDSSSSFAGEGDSSQSNQLSGSVTAIVTRVLPNGNLVLKGKKRITINQGDEFIQISGVVRPSDILSDNSVHSTKVANAEIAYSGDGVITDSNRTGWMSRFFNSKWWPF